MDLPNATNDKRPDFLVDGMLRHPSLRCHATFTCEGDEPIEMYWKGEWYPLTKEQIKDMNENIIDMSQEGILIPIEEFEKKIKENNNV